jgi:hypothetical protein
VNAKLVPLLFILLLFPLSVRGQNAAYVVSGSISTVEQGEEAEWEAMFSFERVEAGTYGIRR